MALDKDEGARRDHENDEDYDRQPEGRGSLWALAG
jgi:hypothetical protein